MKTLKWSSVNRVLDVLFCFGAAVVIFAALGKINHWQNSDIFITIGLLTEVGIFFVMGIIEWVKPKETPRQNSNNVSAQGSQVSYPDLPQVEITQELISFRQNLQRVNNMMENILKSPQ